MAKTPKEIRPFDRIVDEIKRLNLSERGAAAAADLNPSALANVRRHGGNMDLETITKFCVMLGKPVSWALGETPAAGPSALSDAPDAYVSYNQLQRSELNPRKDFGELTDADDAGLPQLANSIRDNGVLQNLLVRPNPKVDTGFIIVFGERRWRAVGILVKEGRWDPDAPNIPVKVREMGDDEHIALAILENLQRKNMNPMEEGEAFAQLQRIDKVKWSTAALAEKIGCTQRLIQQRLQLVAKLNNEAKKALREGSIDVRSARKIAQLPKEQQGTLLKFAGNEVEAPDAQLRAEMLRRSVPAKVALFPTEGDDAVDAGPTLTDEESGEVFFTDRKRFMKAQTAAAAAKAKALQKKHGLGFVKNEGGYFSEYQHEKAEGEKGGVYYVVDGHSGKAEFYVGFKERTQRSYSYSYHSGPKTKEQKAREAEKAKRRTAYNALCKDLAAAIANDPPIALRLALLTLLVDCEKENVPFNAQGVFRQEWGAKVEAPSKLAAFCSKGEIKDSADRAAVWKAIAGITDNQAAAWLAGTVASCIDKPGQYSKIPGTKKGFGADSLLGCIAAALNVEIPEILLPAKERAAAE